MVFPFRSGLMVENRRKQHRGKAGPCKRPAIALTSFQQYCVASSLHSALLTLHTVCILGSHTFWACGLSLCIIEELGSVRGFSLHNPQTNKWNSINLCDETCALQIHSTGIIGSVNDGIKYFTSTCTSLSFSVLINWVVVKHMSRKILGWPCLMDD